MKNLIKKVYNPPRKNHQETLDNIYSPSSVFKYPLARFAILNGLRALMLGRGSSILVPSFICRDVLAPFNLQGMEIVFYEVDEKLNPKLPFDELPKADAILMVHYFGLESDIDYFKSYSKKWNALLIEDNAHGLFSRSRNGKLLGTIGDFGVISVRKSLPVENGAILLLKNDTSSHIANSNTFISPRLKIKNFIRPLVAILGIDFFKKLTRTKRILRSIALGSAVPLSLDYEETEIRYSESPYQFEKYFSTVDIDGEIERRVQLFNNLRDVLDGQPIQNIRENLSAGEVPYVYPFICEPENIGKVNDLVEKMGLEIVKWPSLPNIVKISPHPRFYDNVYLVKFLW